MKEILAIKKETNQKIVERFLEDGTRFFKHIPFNPAIFTQLQNQFQNKNVEVVLGNNNWIRIKKMGESPELKQAAEKAFGKRELTQDEIIKIEADMLRKAGFIVKINTGETP